MERDKLKKECVCRYMVEKIKNKFTNNDNKDIGLIAQPG